MTASRILLATAALGLAAGCTVETKSDEAATDRAERNDGDSATSIDIAAGDDVRITSGDDGKVRVKAPGVDISVPMPDIDIDAADFDIDGVGMYPGTTIRSVNVDAERDGSRDKTVRISMRVPAEPRAVADYFEREMRDEDFTVRRTGNALSGRTEDGDDFTLRIIGTSGGSAGELVLTDRD